MSSSLLEEAAVQTQSQVSHSQRLRTTMAAMRLSFTWFGTRKTLSPDQKAQAAESFGAEGSFLSAGKKLIDVKHPAFKAVSAVKNKAISYFREASLPYREAGSGRGRTGSEWIRTTNLRLRSTKTVLPKAKHE